jgi:hypothetical protein
LFHLRGPVVSIDVGVTLLHGRGRDISSLSDIACVLPGSLRPVDPMPLAAFGAPIVPFHSHLQKLSREHRLESGIRSNSCVAHVCSYRPAHSQGGHIRRSKLEFSQIYDSNVSEQPERRNTVNSVFLAVLELCPLW